MRRMTRILASTFAASAAGAVALGVAARPQPDQPAGPAAGGQDMGRALIEGLRATDGCLGVDAAQTMSGRNTIIAWFENKEAVKRWYYSDVHQSMMRGATDPDEFGAGPLRHVEDEETPIMVVATITFADRPHFESIRMPISQISIELYAPLPGGAFLGRRLAPEEFKVPHMRDYTPKG